MFRTPFLPTSNLPSSLVLTPPVAVPPKHPMPGLSPPFSTPSVGSLDLSILLLSQSLLKRTIISARLASSPTPSLPHPYHLMCALHCKQICSQPQTSTFHSDQVSLGPDGILPPKEKASFITLLIEFDRVFDPRIPGYNGSAGPIQGVVNMGPV